MIFFFFLLFFLLFQQTPSPCVFLFFTRISTPPFFCAFIRMAGIVQWVSRRCLHQQLLFFFFLNVCASPSARISGFEKVLLMVKKKFSRFARKPLQSAFSGPPAERRIFPKPGQSAGLSQPSAKKFPPPPQGSPPTSSSISIVSIYKNPPTSSSTLFSSFEEYKEAMTSIVNWRLEKSANHTQQTRSTQT